MSIFQEIKQGIPNTITIPNELQKLCDWVDENDYPISGLFELREDDGETIKYWMDTDKVSNRFGVFGAGPDGSLYALWIDDDGNQKVVHLGSEGGELYILADNFIDFLRLLAIGYEEIGSADMSVTAEEWNDDDDCESINPEFMEWVETEFKVSVPAKGNEIMDVDDSSFNEWITKQIEANDNN
ncbi:hypothetical protein ABWH96_05245 [Marivirga tractuosa]|uniref:hypothetical protein n=1 Tax=Marivirga tractuosa TaxID=1006 RepID=UPI0035D0C2A0